MTAERPEIAPLIERLEAASEGSRELDAAIECAISNKRLIEVSASGAYSYADQRARIIVCTTGAEHYTTSLDAALTLLRRGYRLYALQHQPNHVDDPGYWFAGVANDVAPITNPPAQSFMAKSKTPAVAMCIAALKALAWAEAAPR